MHTPEASPSQPTAYRPVTHAPFPPPARGELILLIDDEVRVRDLLSTVLLNHGYRVVAAHDAEVGFRLFCAEPDQFSLVISDINLPNISGHTFAELIRPIRPDIRILLMSGIEGTSSPFGERLSADPFLLKPFKPAALLDKIHRLLHPPAVSTP
ncbi:MAG TPA: response regulator [Lacunisphaera sp.]|nr:response regulator [Lacunisphaera sp.]